MGNLAGWEILLGGALVVWVLWRFGRGSSEKLSQKDVAQSGQDDDQPPNDWVGLLLPLGAVFLFVLLLIYSLRA